MYDSPTIEEILQTVANLLRNEIVPYLAGDLSFKVRVAANALDLVRRQITADAAERQDWLERSAELVGAAVTPEDADRRLAERIASAEIGDERALLRHLLATTLAKLAVDQPAYSCGREFALTDQLK